MFVIARADGYCWGKRGYWTLIDSKVKTFKTEKIAINFTKRNGMIDRLEQNRGITAKVVRR